jgi:hypothetical protein
MLLSACHPLECFDSAVNFLHAQLHSMHSCTESSLDADSKHSMIQARSALVVFVSSLELTPRGCFVQAVSCAGRQLTDLDVEAERQTCSELHSHAQALQHHHDGPPLSCCAFQAICKMLLVLYHPCTAVSAAAVTRQNSFEHVFRLSNGLVVSTAQAV